MERFEESIHRLVVETSTNLAPDVREALRSALGREDPGSPCALAFRAIAMDVDLAAERRGPICQDTGMPVFEVRAPDRTAETALAQAIAQAVSRATHEGALRPNSVDSLTGRPSGDSLGPGTPIMHFEQWMSDDVEVRLLLKGGGCENVSAQYSLPTDLPLLGRADRDLEGVRRCVVHAVHAAQGRGCSAGVLGVAVGGDRASGYELAGRQLFRSLDDEHPEPHIAALERAIVAQANALGIGAMGFGGAVTILGCKIETANRLPTSFFVTVAYNCWALRRLGIVLDGRTGEIKRWLYRAERPPRMAEDPRLPLTGVEIRLTTPLSEQEVRSLKVGDVVLLSGTLHTGRDALHHYLLSHEAPVRLQGAALYHCGPMASKRGSEWTVSAAGPTTSIREEPYEADFLRLFGVRAVIGKGGMGPRTLAALEECGAVYLSAIGGAAQFYADHIEKVEGVHFLEFGVPEAMWHLRVRDFPAIVTMDAHGGSLHERVERSSAAVLRQLAVAADS